MAHCTLPATTSPGKLALLYTHLTAGLNHKISWNFVAGVDISDTTAIGVEADRLASMMADALTNSFRITGYQIEDHSGSPFFQDVFPAPYPGTLSAAAGAADWRSTTLCFVGVGFAPAPGVCHGKSISRLFIGNSYLFTPGMKSLLAGGHAELLNFVVNGLDTSIYVPADAYGQQANLLSVLPVQYNAAVQRKYGT